MSLYSLGCRDSLFFLLPVDHVTTDVIYEALNNFMVPLERLHIIHLHPQGFIQVLLVLKNKSSIPYIYSMNNQSVVLVDGSGHYLHACYNFDYIPGEHVYDLYQIRFGKLTSTSSSVKMTIFCFLSPSSV